MMTATLTPNSIDRPTATAKVAAEIHSQWQTRLATESPQHNEATRSSIIDWLLGEDRDRWETLEPQELQIARAMGLQTQQIYRLRENIKYQAAKVFWDERSTGISLSMVTNLCPRT